MIFNRFNLPNFTTLSIIVTFFIFSNIFSQELGSNSPEIKDKADLIFDSLITDFNDAGIDTIRVNVLNEIAWHYAPTNYLKSTKFADSALTLAKNIGWKKGEAYALKHKGEAFRYNGQMEKSILSHEVSLSIFEKLNDKIATASLLGNIGISYNQLSNYSKSYEFYDKALNIFHEVNNLIGIQKINIYLGILFHDMKDYAKSLEKYEYALKYATDLDDKYSKASLIGNIGSVYHDMKNYDEASKYYNIALNSFRELNDIYNYSLFLGNLGNLYSDQGLFNKAIQYNKEALNYYSKIGNKFGVAIQTGNLGVINFKIASQLSDRETLRKNELLKSSEIGLNTAISKLDELGNKEAELFYLNTLVDLYKTRGEYQAALNTIDLLQQLKDSMYNSKTKKKIAEIGVQQDLRLKQKEIEILNKDKEYERLIRNIVIFFAILSVFFSLFINRLYKKNQRRNKVLEENIVIRKEAETALKKNEAELNKHKNNLELVVNSRTSELEMEVLERKRTEEDLLLAIDRVEAANKAKSVFLENMSHELRTPLVGILGYSGLLSSEVPSKDLKEMADGINRTGNRLLNTLSMVLDLARIESDKFEINLSEVDIKEELTDIYNNFKGALSIKKINFKLIFLDETRFVLTDSGMLKVIIENLVNNAIKFTKAGSITIESGTQIEDNKNKFLFISVKDTGIGIKQNEIQIIFKEFKQLSEGTLKDFQGTGLGLSISKKFTEHLHGELLVESEFGVGSKFTVKLPYN